MGPWDGVSFPDRKEEEEEKERDDGNCVQAVRCLLWCECDFFHILVAMQVYGI